jgi:NAD(P)-dependent dehydrogenase (short-subunit alcohol dehydrogenase family)
MAALSLLSRAFRLDGRRALVTGGGRGLGKAIALGLAEAGAHVVVAARTNSEIDALVETIADGGGSAEALMLDVTDIAGVARALRALPCCDILVNNAGTNRPKPIGEVSEGDYDAVVDLNLKGAYFVAKAVAARLLAEKLPGSIVNMSSQMGRVGAANRTLYCMTKHGIEGLTKALAVELAPHGIRVNAVAPTFIETPLTRPYFDDAAFKAEVLGKIPLGRLGVPEDIAPAVVYLASDASSLVTGTTLLVDGGWTAQ